MTTRRRTIYASFLAVTVLPLVVAWQVTHQHVLLVMLVPTVVAGAYLLRALTGAERRERITRERVSEVMQQSQAIARISDDRLAQLAGAIREVIWLTSPDGARVLYISPSFQSVWGLDPHALYANPRAWLELVHPADRPRVQACAWTAEVVDEFRVRRPDGAVRWLRVKGAPVPNRAGAITGYARVTEDITERRELEEQLRQTQKLESVGLLAGGIAHDFNNILGVITANADLIAEELPAAHAHRELVEEIEAAVGRAAALTRQLLAFSRKQVTDPVVLDVNRSVADVRKMLRRVLGTDIELKTSLEPDVGRVRFDPSSLVQVLMNLAVNARDAMPTGGTLTIATRKVPGDQLVLSVTDTGCGMTGEVMERLFEPFFTTKPVGKGTGLGLPVVHGIVEQAGGHIDVTSELGVGTTVEVRIPTVDAPIDPTFDRAALAARGHEKIVLVEDDCYVRAAASRALRARGYTVLEASEGRTALRLLRDHKADVRLLVTDIVMPGMNGRELAELAHARMPELCVLFMSGYADDNGLRQSIEHDGVAFIEKPFRIPALAAKVRQVLDEQDSVHEWADSSVHLTQPIDERELDAARTASGPAAADAAW